MYPCNQEVKYFRCPKIETYSCSLFSEQGFEQSLVSVTVCDRQQDWRSVCATAGTNVSIYLRRDADRSLIVSPILSQESPGFSSIKGHWITSSQKPKVKLHVFKNPAPYAYILRFKGLYSCVLHVIVVIRYVANNAEIHVYSPKRESDWISIQPVEIPFPKGYVN